MHLSLCGDAGAEDGLCGLIPWLISIRIGPSAIRSPGTRPSSWVPYSLPLQSNYSTRSGSPSSKYNNIISKIIRSGSNATIMSLSDSSSSSDARSIGGPPKGSTGKSVGTCALTVRAEGGLQSGLAASFLAIQGKHQESAQTSLMANDLLIYNPLLGVWSSNLNGLSQR
jgi:hypothetical protein